MENSRNPVARTNDLVIQNSGAESLIYDLKDHKALCLNSTTNSVWKLCDGKNSVSLINRKLFGESKRTESIVELAILQLAENNLLMNSKSVLDPAGQISRRQVIRNAALTSAVLLPAVILITAPRAAHAQSCVNPGGAPPGNIVSTIIDSPVGSAQTVCTNTDSSRCCSGSASITTCAPDFQFPQVNRCNCACN
ncbi:MAG: hypothetical protein R2681_02605 [Pyrinomonadaceae bacterium]